MTAAGSEPLPADRAAVMPRHPIWVHLAVMFGYISVGIAVNWPHATYLVDGRLPERRDTASYVWGLWWMARSVVHLSDPWVTHQIAAPVGTYLGMHALVPLAGIVMLPVTMIFGPSAAYNLLSIALPGLLGYAMWRVARLWLPSQTGALAAGAFFGFAAMVDYQAWLHLNLAAGDLFLPLTLEAVVRLRRRPGLRGAAVLGVTLGASMLTDQESAVLALMLALAAIVPWLLPATWPSGAQMPRADLAPGPPGHVRPARAALARLSGKTWLAKMGLLGFAGLVAVVVAAPQLVAILQAHAAGIPPATLGSSWYLRGIPLPGMFLPSPRVASFSPSAAHSVTAHTYGAIPTLLALTGLALAWRRRNARLLAAFWLGAALLALGSDIHLPSGSYTPFGQILDGARVSAVLPFTWFVKIPGLSGFREPWRVAVLGLIPVALLAGYTVNWLRFHSRRLLVAVLVLGVFEAGLATPPKARITMPASMPALDNPIAADHSRSIVLDIPFGLRGGTGIVGLPFAPQTQVLATADGHPLADALLSRVPTSTIDGIFAQPFYHDLISVQTGHFQFTHAEYLVAAKNAIRMHIGWVLLWIANKNLMNYLVRTGFRYVHMADGVSVWRPAGGPNAAAAKAAIRVPETPPEPASPCCGRIRSGSPVSRNKIAE